MKSAAKLARLILFFSVSFVGIFVVSAFLRWFSIRIGTAGLLPSGEKRELSAFLTAARWALALSAHAAVLLSLSYSVRCRIFSPLSIFCIALLACGLNFAGSWALERAGFLPPARTEVRPPGKPGLILSQPGSSVVLLGKPGDSFGPRVVAAEGQPLLYQENPQGPNNTAPYLPRIPFLTEGPYFLKSLAIDINLAAARMAALFDEGVLPFLIYTASLMFFLSSLRFVLDFSVWPLANLFLGVLVFRGIFALEVFINSQEINDYLGFYLGKPSLTGYAVPVCFCFFAMLICLYTFLVSLIRRRPHEAS